MMSAAAINRYFHTEKRFIGLDCFYGPFRQYRRNRAFLKQNLNPFGDFKTDISLAHLGHFAHRPPPVVTSSPFANAESMVRCSLWRFICGRIMMKCKTANIAISGKKLIRPDWEADVAFCANAEEIKGTCNLHWDKMRCFAQPRCSAQRPLPTRLCETPENNRGILASPLNSACAA